MTGGSMDALLQAAASRSPPTAPATTKPPAFLSPEPAAATARELMQRTLSEGARKKKPQKRKLMERSADGPTATPTILKRKKKLPIGDTPQSSGKPRASGKENEQPMRKQSSSVLEDMPHKLMQDGVEGATRRLEFAATPSKPEKNSNKKEEATPEVSSPSSSSEDDEGDVSSASSDECEVTFDAMTLGNLRIVREAVPSPLSTMSSASSGSTKLVGLEYQFAVSSTVSSIAVAPNGEFLVVGFYNGTIYLYPLTKDSVRYRHGVMLDHIPSRGMYTQLRVKVSLPADGKFIFAGVYRGSTEIRAFEVDSIELPSVERLAQAASQKGTDDESSDDDSDNDEGTGVPTARFRSHTYSDAKLKGFSDVKSVVRKFNNKTEYHLLCGLGIKNIHLWRFFHDETANKWAWECIFDKQNNGISIETLCFHRNFDNQIISKSEHQNIRIWNLEEDVSTGGLRKKSHVDIKQSVDATAVYGDHAYGGGESLALIDLRSFNRMELDLPLSVKEQEAKQTNARVTAGTRITASLRGRRSGTRGRGTTDDSNGQRLMRMVSQVAGEDAAPFVVGMCTDGSVFMHRPQPETMGIATPLEYVEGYEQFFQDPSLSFQAQYSDLTRVNTSGLLGVLPLPQSEKEDWMVVAANANQLLVRSLEAFLHRNEQKQEQSRVKRGLRNALRDMGSNTSSSESDSDDESSEEEVTIKRKPLSRSTVDPVRESKRERLAKLDLRNEESKNEKPRAVAKPVTVTNGEQAPKKSDPANSSSSKPLPDECENSLPLVDIQLHMTSENSKSLPSAQVSTPVRTQRDAFMSRSSAVPSPVVSISSPSASSNPNTPERVKLLSEEDRRSLVVKELEWTPQPSAQSSAGQVSMTANQIVEATISEKAEPIKRGRTQKRKPGKSRSKGVAQALFVNDDAESNQVVDTPVVEKNLKRHAEVELRGGPEKKLAIDPNTCSSSTLDDEECTDVEDEGEDEFTMVPLQSDGGSLLAAALFQYSSEQSCEGVESSRQFSTDEVHLMMRFSGQLERLRRSYNVDRERIMRQFNVTECECGTSKKKTMAGSKMNWRKQIASEASKKKHIKRRQKKLLSSRLRDLHMSYKSKLVDIRIIQRLELQAFTARQEFQLLASQA